MFDPTKAQDTQPLLTERAKVEPRRAEAFLQMPVLPAAPMAVPSFPEPPARWENMELPTTAAGHKRKERRYSRSRPPPHSQRPGKVRGSSCDESDAVHPTMPLPETMRFKMPSPAKSSKAMTPLTGTAAVGIAPGKRPCDVTASVACNAESSNPDTVLVAPHIPREPAVEQADHPPNEPFCDSKESHSAIPQNIDVGRYPTKDGRPTAVPGGHLQMVGEGSNWDVSKALDQPADANFPRLCALPTFHEGHGKRRLSKGGGSLVPNDIVPATAPATRPAGILRQHVFFANSGSVLPGDTKSSASSSAETNRTSSSSSSGFSSEATGWSMGKRMAIIGVCFACVAVLSFWAFYAIAEVVIVSHEFLSENGDRGTVPPQDEGAVDLPPRLFSNPSGFQQRAESAVSRGGILAVPAERITGNETSTEDFTDAVENS